MMPLWRGGASLCLLLLLSAAFAANKKKPPGKPININTASSEELQQVPGNRVGHSAKNFADAQVIRTIQKRRRFAGHSRPRPEASRQNAQVLDGGQIRAKSHRADRYSKATSTDGRTI